MGAGIVPEIIPLCGMHWGGRKVCGEVSSRCVLVCVRVCVLVCIRVCRANPHGYICRCNHMHTLVHIKACPQPPTHHPHSTHTIHPYTRTSGRTTGVPCSSVPKKALFSAGRYLYRIPYASAAARVVSGHKKNSYVRVCGCVGGWVMGGGRGGVTREVVSIDAVQPCTVLCTHTPITINPMTTQPCTPTPPPTPVCWYLNLHDCVKRDKTHPPMSTGYTTPQWY